MRDRVLAVVLIERGVRELDGQSGPATGAGGWPVARYFHISPDVIRGCAVWAETSRPKSRSRSRVSKEGVLMSIGVCGII